jgi:hypothetical protein
LALRLAKSHRRLFTGIIFSNFDCVKNGEFV